jgi:hypothetical protein
MFNNFFLENRAVCEKMSKNVAEPERPQMTLQYGAYELHAGQAWLHARTRANTHKYVIFIGFAWQQ